tara:strand:+ start:375919 stop:376926 length:1008 start_codon:yes stop_codon:yes gene_type:complete
MAKPPKRRSISLALQGGGAHGAYTWGVLDRLAEEDDLDIAAISATSAGAINAAAWGSGFAKDGAAGAKKSLEAVWRSVSHSGSGMAPFGTWGAMAFAYASALQSLASPYDFNPFNLNPLRQIINAEIDFDALHESGIKLFLSATNVESGRVKVFERGEINADTVLASACLPQVFQAVEIDGNPYWDGGYMGNPSLFPLVYSGSPRDVLLVMLNPLARPGIPRRAGEISERINEISFNASLIGELRAIAFVQRLIDEGMLRETVMKKYRRLNIHAIRGGKDLLGLDLSSKYDTSWDFLTKLRDLGRAAADAWLTDDAHLVGGKTSNIDLRKEFLEI